MWKSRWPSLTVRRAIFKRSHEKIGDCEQSRGLLTFFHWKGRTFLRDKAYLRGGINRGIYGTWCCSASPEYSEVLILFLFFTCIHYCLLNYFWYLICTFEYCIRIYWWLLLLVFNYNCWDICRDFTDEINVDHVDALRASLSWKSTYSH